MLCLPLGEALSQSRVLRRLTRVDAHVEQDFLSFELDKHTAPADLLAGAQRLHGQDILFFTHVV